jgi:hypothetical protein
MAEEGSHASGATGHAEQMRLLAAIAQWARQAYVERIAHGLDGVAPWWTAVVVTASSARQAERYEEEIGRRREAGTLPGGVRYLVLPDLQGPAYGQRRGHAPCPARWPLAWTSCAGGGRASAS